MQSFGQRLLELEVCDSTNRLLLESPEFRDSPEGFSILARSQSAGRGRGDRSWDSPPGGLYLTTLLRPKRTEGLTFLGALSMLEALQEAYRVPVQLRWPNDLVVKGSKLCGVLAQAVYRGASPERVVIGVGLNVDRCPTLPPPFTATFLRQYFNSDPARDLVLETARAYLTRLEENYKEYCHQGETELIKRVELHLEGLQDGVQGSLVDSEGGLLEVLPRMVGLGSGGELRFEGGAMLRDLKPGQRFRPLRKTS